MTSSGHNRIKYKHSKKTKIKISDIKTKTGIGNYRKRALKNLNHICNKCNVDNIKILIVHHIDRNRYNNDLDNLEILCRNCHFLEHVDEWRKSRK